MIKDINDYYFTDEDYDLFIEEKQTQNGNVIREDRKIAQEKLLDLNSKLLPKLQIEGHMDLHNHKNPDNITSLIFPCVYNKGMVNWIGVRYGKHKDFIALLNEMLPKYPTYNKYGERMPVKDTKRGFQKYACMQVNIGYTGVDVGMYHAVPHDAIDRWYLRENIREPELRNKIITELKDLKGYGYRWEIWNINEENLAVFDFDSHDVEEFPDWYYKFDLDGSHSSMLVHFPRYSEKLKKDVIVDTCYNIINQLYPFYKLCSWKPNVNAKGVKKEWINRIRNQ